VQIFNNISKIIRDDLIVTIEKGSKGREAASLQVEVCERSEETKNSDGGIMKWLR
jgi:hypothetical protein